MNWQEELWSIQEAKPVSLERKQPRREESGELYEVGGQDQRQDVEDQVKALDLSLKRKRDPIDGFKLGSNMIRSEKIILVCRWTRMMSGKP